jgi:hypothetical protein
VARGSTVNVTLGGANFGGATTVRLFNADGSAASDITASIVNIDGGGNSLNATLSVSPFASEGRKVIVLTTPKGHSVLGDVTVNIIRITAP